MTAADLVRQIEQDGAQLTLTAAGKLRITGEHAERWYPVIAQYRQELTEALQAPASAHRSTAG